MALTPFKHHKPLSSCTDGGGFFFSAPAATDCANPRDFKLESNGLTVQEA
jgi:hypothetical protein